MASRYITKVQRRRSLQWAARASAGAEGVIEMTEEYISREAAVKALEAKKNEYRKAKG